MKKYFKLLTVLFLLMITVNVNAEDNYYVEKTRDVDYSKITFKDTDGNDVAHSSLGILEFSTTVDANNNLTNAKYSYCLDKHMKYPMGYHAYISEVPDGVTIDPDTHAEQIVMFGFYRELINNETLRNQVKNEVGDSFQNGPTFEFYHAYGTSASELVNAFNTGNEVTVTITKVSYDNAVNSISYPLTIKFKKSDVMYLDYSVTSLGGNYDYNHALWILEHSYPTLTVEKALEEAGASYTTLLTEMETLYTGKTADEIKSLAADYVFAVVQHSIWRAADASFNGKKLGDTLTGSTELNKLYQWLNQDREIYTNYDSLSYDNTIEFIKPATGKEVFSSTSDTIKYGPYAIDAKVVSTANITVEVTDTYKDKVKLVDKLGNEITSFENGTEFYISVPKKEKISEVNIKASAENALVFEPSSNRGKIYYSIYPYFQNVVVGGQVSTTNVVGTIKLQYNPATGVENVAILFVVTLVSFAVGYMVLNYKNKPVTF